MGTGHPPDELLLDDELLLLVSPDELPLELLASPDELPLDDELLASPPPLPALLVDDELLLTGGCPLDELAASGVVSFEALSRLRPHAASGARASKHAPRRGRSKLMQRR